ncbi:MAG: hypothetical protein ACXWX6_10655 [Actinomycetota bacterium]
MSANARSAARRGRLILGGVAAGLIIVLGLSFLMASRALESSEADAEARAERYATSGIATGLEPDQVEADITGSAYRALLLRVQGEILADPDVKAVRIWRPNGDLIFSTVPRDDVAEVVAVDQPEIQAAARDGVTTSVVSTVADAPPADPEASTPDLFVTYLPLRFANEPEPLGAIEIAQDHGAIRDDANRIWRPVQVATLVALAAVGVLFAIAQRASMGSRARPSAQTFGPRDDRRLRDAEDRAEAAERAAREVEGRLADADRRLADAASAEPSAEVRARVEELEMKLRAEKAEREQFADEAERLRSALAEAEKAVAAVRDGNAASDREYAASIEAVARAEALTVEAERRAASAGALAAEVGDRAAVAEAKVTDLQAALRDAERRSAAALEDVRAETDRLVQDARAEAERIAQEARSEADRVAQEARTESDRTRADEIAHVVYELERSRAAASEARGELDASRLDLERVRLELDAVRDELEASRSGLVTSAAEREQVAAELERSNADRARLKGELERSSAEVQLANAGLERANAELERANADRERLGADLEAERARPAPPVQPERDTEELEVRLAQVETQRREEIAELQRIQEAYSNAQLELMDANRRVEEAEDRARALESRLVELGPAEPERAEPGQPPAGADESPPVRRSEPADVPVFGEPRPRRARPPAQIDPAAREPAPEEEAVPEDEPEAPELPEETLSLRERLARAAAARHRTTQPPE